MNLPDAQNDIHNAVDVVSHLAPSGASSGVPFQLLH
jgi:hypothetical protein